MSKGPETEAALAGARRLRDGGRLEFGKAFEKRRPGERGHYLTKVRSFSRTAEFRRWGTLNHAVILSSKLKLINSKGSVSRRIRLRGLLH